MNDIEVNSTLLMIRLNKKVKSGGIGFEPMIPEPNSDALPLGYPPPMQHDEVLIHSFIN